MTNALLDMLELIHVFGELIEIDDMRDPYIESGRIHHRFVGALLQELAVAFSPVAIALGARPSDIDEDIEALKLIARG